MALFVRERDFCQRSRPALRSQRTSLRPAYSLSALASQQQKLLASDGAAGDSFGRSVSVSGDTVVVGAYADDTPGGANAGSAYVFVRSGTTWTVSASNERGYLGTTPAAHTNGSTVYLVQRANVAACGSSPCTDKVATKTVTGADGRAYKVDTYVTWKQITNSGSTTGRLVKLVSIVVRGNSSPYPVYARVSSAFDESTGQ